MAGWSSSFSKESYTGSTVGGRAGCCRYTDEWRQEPTWGNQAFQKQWYINMPSAQGRHEHPCPHCSRRYTKMRSRAPQADWDSKVKSTPHSLSSLTQHSLKTTEMSPLTFNGFWMGPRISALIKIGGQDYYRIKTSLIQMPLALCHNHAYGFCALGKPGKAATKMCKMCSRRAPHDGRAHTCWQHRTA